MEDVKGNPHPKIASFYSCYLPTTKLLS